MNEHAVVYRQFDAVLCCIHIQTCIYHYSIFLYGAAPLFAKVGDLKARRDDTELIMTYDDGVTMMILMMRKESSQ